MGANEARAELSAAARQVWANPDMISMRNTLAADADAGFAQCLKSAMAAGRGGRGSFEACAQKTGLSAKYRVAWGKPSA